MWKNANQISPGNRYSSAPGACLNMLPHYNHLYQYIEYWADEAPDFVTLHSGGKDYTAGELREQINRLACAMLEQGLQKGDVVMTILGSCAEYVISWVAANRVGAIVAPMDVRYRAADYARLIPHIAPKIIISPSATGGFELAPTLAQHAPNAIWWMTNAPAENTSLQNTIANAKINTPALAQRAAQLALDDGALIIFTGGTTGAPKAALLSHRNCTELMFCEAEILQNALAANGVTGRVKTFAALPPSHVGGTLEVIGSALLAGWELFMRESWSPNKMLEVTARERIPIMLGVPTMFAMTLSLPDLGAYDLSCVKLAVMSGEKVGRELLDGIRRRICHHILNGYGSTEAGAEVTFTDLNDDFALLADGYVGRPIAGQEVRIVNDEDAIAQTGQIGEVVVKGPLTIGGYYNMPAEDAAGFTADGWCRTGDLGLLDECGGLWIRGRKKQIIRVGGYTVIPNEIEELVAQLPGVAQAVAIGVPDAVKGEAVWLVLQPREGETIDVDKVLAVCRAQLANYKVPARVVLEQDIPVTRIGKADRIELRARLVNTKKSS